VIIKIMPEFWKNPFFNIIYSFHMPLFFVVSGYLIFLTLRGSRLRWIRDKAFYLLIPHFLVNAAIYYLSPTNLTEFPNVTKSFASFPGWMYASTVLDQGEWFLWTLLIVFCLMLIIDLANGTLKSGKLFLVVALILAIGFIFSHFANTDILKIHEVQYYFPFALAGYLLAKYAGQIRRIITKVNVSLALPAVTVLYIIVMYLSKWNGGWGSTPISDLTSNLSWVSLRYAQAIFGLPLLLVVVLSLDGH
jgi:fucose 4-O-acetylase-like acetyltransferase